MPLILPPKKRKLDTPAIKLQPGAGTSDVLWPPHPRAVWEMNDHRTWGSRFPDKPWPGSVARLKVYDAEHGPVA